MVSGQSHVPASLPQERDTAPLVQETVWVPSSVWTGTENLAPSQTRSPDRPSHRQYLYQLCYLVCIVSNLRMILKREMRNV